MPGLNADILKPGLKALYYSGAHRMLAPFSKGVGLIYMLHRVSPHRPGGFAPNRGLMVTPEYLNSVLAETKRAGLDIVSLDEAHRRLRDGDFTRRFACFTLDDGYRDNLEYAYPVFAAHDAAFTVYIPSDYPDGKGELWWVALEEIIASGESIEIAAANENAVLPIGTDAEKNGAFAHIYRYLRNMDQDAQRAGISALCAKHGLDMGALCRNLIMTWDEVRQLAADPLVTIGAHTAAHYALAALPEARAREEMKHGADRIAAELGLWPEHISYPYGDSRSAGPREFRIAGELGFKTAVTTRKGVIFREHAEYLTALPRVSLNGEFQSSLYTRLFMSGAPFALWNRFRRVDAA
ncbi:MAG TPA: polysaccharide deacetylase [Rhizobiales bacterium]|nr:polysaccharide deacetylase [bacterium BMS3Bbin10]HDO51900.1 polysaccharide deacetylase [Hyphomicrobiales bacterium]